MNGSREIPRALPGWIAVLGLSVLLACASEAASAPPEQRGIGEAWLTVHLSAVVHTVVTVDEIRSKLLQDFSKADVDGGGLSESDRALRWTLLGADRWSASVAELLRMDQNGNGRVTRAEVEAHHLKKELAPLGLSSESGEPVPEHTAEWVRKLSDRTMRFDRDRNQVIALSEILRELTQPLDPYGFPRRRRPGFGGIPLELDADGDRIVSRHEFLEAVDRVLDRFDADGDGRLSPPELAALRDEANRLTPIVMAADRARKERIFWRAAREACGFPPVTPGAKIVVLSAEHGRALSTVGLAGDGVPVSVADVKIEPGSVPLYLMLVSARAMIWRFAGAIERVEAVVAGTRRRRSDQVPQTGLVGIPARRVHIPLPRDCLRYLDRPRGRHSAEEKTRFFRQVAGRTGVANLVGRAPDLLLVTRRFGSVSLPGGARIDPKAKPFPDTGAGAILWQELRPAYPDGLAEVDADRVVSKAAVKPHAVLPQRAGLARLLDAGALRIIGKRPVAGDRAPGETADAVDRPSAFLILKKIRFPGGLGGVAFQLAPGVPEPEGDPGGACVRYQATGRPWPGSHGCR